MPAVNPSKVPKAKYSGSWSAWQYLKTKTEGSWEFVKKVYVKSNGSWVEVWNARPEVTSGSFTASASSLSFSGSVDPNNFTSTAYYNYREAGTSTWTASGTTATGSPADGSRSFSVTASIANPYKNWEAQAMATNAGGTSDAGSTVTLDCRQHDAGGSGWSSSDSSNASTCDSCGTVTTRTYTKSGCPSYSRTITTCGTWGPVSDEFFPTGCYGPLTNGTYPYAAYSLWGWIYYTDSGCNNAVASCSGGGLLGPVGVTKCSVTGQYRVEGGDTCVYPSCC